MFKQLMFESALRKIPMDKPPYPEAEHAEEQQPINGFKD